MSQSAALGSQPVFTLNGNMLDPIPLSSTQAAISALEFGSNGGDFAQSYVDGAAPPSLVGDLNGDGFVGQDDLNIILGAWGQNVDPPGDPLTGDPSNDGFVGQDDLNFVLGGWGQGTPQGGISAVPEPQSILLVIAAIVALQPICRRSRRRSH
jgi:hypothetical protein